MVDSFVHIVSFDEYHEFISGRSFYNLSFFPEESKRYIADKRLYGIETDSIRFIVFDEGTYCQIAIEQNCEIQVLVKALTYLKKQPVLCFVVKDSDEVDDYERLLQGSGFKIRQEAGMYVLKAKDFVSDSAMDKHIRNQIKAAEIPAIMKMWHDELPMEELPLLNRNDVDMLWAQDRQLFIYEVDGIIVGVICYDGFMGSCTLRHLVVKREYRGKGIAKALLQHACRSAKEKGYRKMISWVDNDNTASQKAVEKIGFVRNNNKSYRYMKG